MRRHGKRQGRGKKTSVIKRRNIEAGGKNSNGTRSSGSQAYIHSFLCKSGAERRDTLILQPQDVRWGNAEFSISNLLLGGILNHLHSPNRRLHVRNSFLPGNKIFARFGLVWFSFGKRLTASVSKRQDKKEAGAETAANNSLLSPSPTPPPPRQ